MDPGKCKALLDWVNSTGIETCVDTFSQLADGVIVAEVIKHMQILPEEADNHYNSEKPWIVVKELLNASNLRCAVQHIDWHSLEKGNENEIAKVVLLLLSLSISCPNKEKLILEMTNLDYETQNHIRHILTEALNEGIPSPHNLFDLMTLKAPSSEQLELDFSDSPARNSPIAPATSVNSVNESPLILHNRSIQSSNRGIFRTPVKQIFRSLEEEEVYFSVPASCPPLRRGGNTRHNLQDIPSFNASAECSPMQEFLASPVINYRIKIRDLEQKATVLDKNLHAERVAKEEIQKVLLEKEAAFEKMERKIREMSRCSIDKQRLFDEIDELHAVKLERDSLEKENYKLKHRLEKFDTYSNECKDLKRDLDSQLKQNEELLKQVKLLKNSLEKVSKETSRTSEIEESLKSSQERNTLQEQEISHLVTQLHKLKSQNIEQKEHYESRIADYKAVIEEKDSSCVENEGESMGIFMEHRVLELQETLKEMEESWIKPDTAAKMRSDLDATKETMESYRTKLHSVGGEKMSLEEEVCRLQQELTSKTGEIMDSMKKLASANQKLKNSDSVVETLRAKSEALSGDKESLKKRIRELETDLRESNNNIGKLQVELNLTKNENDDKAMLIESHIRRLSDSSNKITGFEQQCCLLESALSEKDREFAENKREYEARLESFEKKITEDKSQISKLEDDIKVLEENRESSNREVQTLQQDVLQEKQNLLEAKQEIGSLKEEVKRYHAACAELEENCNILHVKLQDARTKAEKSLKNKEEEVAILHQEEASLKAQISDLQEILCQKNRMLKTVNEKLDEYQNNLVDSANEKKCLWQEKEELEKIIRAKTEACSNFKMELEEAVAALEESNKSCSSLESELTTLRDEFDTKMKEKEDAVEVLHIKLNDDGKKYSNLHDDFELCKDALDKKREEFVCVTSQLQGELDELHLCIEKAKESNVKKVEEIAKMEEDMNRLKAEHNEEVSSLRNVIEDKESRCIEYASAVGNLTTKIEEWKKKIEDVENLHQEEANETEDALLKANDVVENHFRKICELEKDLQEKMQNHKDELNCREKELESLQTTLHKVESEKAILHNDLEAVKSSSVSQARNNEEALAKIRREKEEIQTYLREFEDNVKNLATKLEEAQGFGMQQQKLVEDVQAQYHAEMETSAALRNELEESRRKEQDEREELNNLQKEFVERVEKNASFLSELEESRMKVDEMQHKLSEMVKNLDATEELEQSHAQRLKDAEICNVQIMEAHQVLTEKFTALDLEKQMLEQQISTKDCSLQKLDEDVKAREENLHLKISKLEENIEFLNLEAEKGALNHKEELEKVATSHQQNTKAFECELDEKNQEVERMFQDLSDLVKEKENYQEQIENLKEISKEADITINAFKEKQEKDILKIQELEEKVKLLEAQIEVDNVARDETVADLIRVKMQVETSEKVYQDDIENLNDAVSTLEENLLKATERCSASEEDSKALVEIKSSFSDLEAENVKLSDELSSLQKHHDFEKNSAQNKMQELEENHSIQVGVLEEQIKEVGEENEKLKKELESVVEIMNSMKDFYEVKIKTYETEATKSKQEFDFLKVENETLLKSNDDTVQRHLEEITKSQSTTDKTLKLLENEKERYAVLEGRLKKEVLGVENELSQARNSLKTVIEEKQFYEKHSHNIEEQHRQTCFTLQQTESRFNQVQLENSELRVSLESFKDEKEKADEKVKIIRTQFTEKYRAKQERILKLEQDLKDWQARADEQTNKYDNMAAMFKEGRIQLNETVNNLDQVREENLDLQEAVRTLKAKNEMLTSNSSQLNVQKIEEEKRIRQLTAENQRLSTQLQFAERRIRQLRADSCVPFRHSTLLSEPLKSVEEEGSSASSRRRSLDISADDMFSSDNLFRCRSDTFLDSPSTANKKARKDDQEQLDDSLDDILRTPVNLQYRNNAQKQNAEEKQSRGKHDEDRMPTDQSHMSIESSLLSDTPSCRKSRCFSQSHPQLNLSNLNTSRISHESADINMNSSNLAEASFVANDSSRGSAGQRSGMARHPSSLAFQTEEEPEDYEWGSLSRLAELQRRNAATLPHLKSSYPIETQGQTPSRSDESVRVGDADGTLRRMTQTSAALQRSLAAANDYDARSRRMTIDVNSDLLRRHEPSRRPLSSVSENATLPKRKNSHKDNSLENMPPKNRRGGSEMTTDFKRSSKPEQNQWNGVIQMEPEEKEQIDPRSRMSMMFEIPNSPRKPALRSRTSKKSTAAEKTQNENVPSTSKRISSLMKTPDKSKTAKKNTEEKRRTPSLMDRVKRPLGRFNSKK